MAASVRPTTQYLSTNFVISAGSILFRQSPESNKLQICLLYHRQTGRWGLPKGRKDCGESIEAAAVRETFEETGYTCELLPCRMPTRATEPNVNILDSVRTLPNISEPIALTVEDWGESGVKTIWWFLTRVKSNSAEKSNETQADYEQYDSHFVDAEEAITLLSFEKNREVATQALRLVKDSLMLGDQLFSHSYI